MKSLRTYLFPLLALTTLTMSMAQSTLPPETPAQKSQRMKWFREARFGMFIHWGLYAVPAGEWKERKNHGEWILTTAEIPLNEYEKFRDQFNPVKFDAEKWVLMAKNAGMKYIVLTSKHHEGFALWDSKVSDWDIMSTPFKRDILAELAAACRKHDMKICWYHSIMDWHHPDYLPRRSWEKRPADGADFDRFVKYLHSQVTEILTKYGDISILWFDGEWESTWNHKYGQALYDLCRRLQPNIIVNNRVDIGRAGMSGFTDGEFAGDYGTPEQEIPATGMPGVDWETCMTMNNTWGYSKSDHNWKSSTEMIRMLCDIASKGGNYLLNVGPTAEGEFPPESVERLEQIGKWMKVNSEAIYSTTASPCAAPKWGRITSKPDGKNTTLFLHVFDWPKDGKLVLRGLGNKGLAAKGLGFDQKLAVSGGVDNLVIEGLPSTAPGGKDPSVVKLTLEGSPIPLNAPTIHIEADIFISDREVKIDSASKEIEVRYTTDGSAPTVNSTRYGRPFKVRETVIVKAQAFYKGMPVGDIVEMKLSKVSPRAGAKVGATIAGLIATDYEGSWKTMPDFKTLTSTSVGQSTTVAIGPLARKEYVGRVLEGYVVIPEDGIYRFELGSDDGSKMYIGGAVVVDNDGLHGYEVKVGQIALAKGYHPIRVEWFNATGGAELKLKMAKEGQTAAEVAATVLVHEKR